MKQCSSCLCPTRWHVVGSALIRLKQWNRLLNLDFHDFSITKCCLNINQEQHKYSWILSGAVWWNGLLFEVSSSLLNLQHLCTWCWSDCTLFHYQCCVWQPVCDVSKVSRACEQSSSELSLWSLDLDHLWHPLLSPFIAIPLLVLGQKVWGRKAPWDPWKSLRSSWHREEQVWRAWVHALG